MAEETYEQILQRLLKEFAFITVDFGAGELIVDPITKNCLSITEENDYGI